MRLQELFLTQEDQKHKRAQKVAKLKQAIEDGQAPEVHNAGASLEGFSWGDLNLLGWAEKKQRSTNTGPGTAEVWWQYSAAAPGPITLLTNYTEVNGDQITRGVRPKVMQPGDTTDPIEVDYS